MSCLDGVFGAIIVLVKVIHGVGLTFFCDQLQLEVLQNFEQLFAQSGSGTGDLQTWNKSRDEVLRNCTNVVHNLIIQHSDSSLRETRTEQNTSATPSAVPQIEQYLP